MEFQQLQEKCEDWIEEDLSYVDIKRRLKNTTQATEEEQKRLLLKVDEIIAVNELKDQAKQQALIKILLSGLFLILGISTYLISPDNYRVVAILTGGAAYYFGKNAYADYKNPKVDSPLSIKKKKGRFDRF